MKLQSWLLAPSWQVAIKTSNCTVSEAKKRPLRASSLPIKNLKSLWGLIANPFLCIRRYVGNRNEDRIVVVSQLNHNFSSKNWCFMSQFTIFCALSCHNFIWVSLKEDSGTPRVAGAIKIVSLRETELQKKSWWCMHSKKGWKRKVYEYSKFWL